MEGGMIVTDDEEIYHILLRCVLTAGHGICPRKTMFAVPRATTRSRSPLSSSCLDTDVGPLEMEGALGIEQVKRLGGMIAERRKNGGLLQAVLGDHPEILIQQEVGESSWFGFSLVIRPGSPWTRKLLIGKLTELGFECRPIVAGNFAKNEVVRYFDAEVHGVLRNAERIDKCGLFVGNHHYPIPEAMAALAML